MNAYPSEWDDLDHVDALLVSPAQFRQTPQRGTPARLHWSEFVAMLASPMRADAKDAAGGIAFGVYDGNVRRKAVLVRTNVLSLDVDGGVAASTLAEALPRVTAIVLETFTSAPDAPRCRAFFLLSRPVDVATYEALHAPMRLHIRAIGGDVDESAKDASRLSYLPVRRPGAPYAFRELHGPALDVDRMLAALPPAPPRPAPRVVPAQHADRYKRGALDRAAQALASAREGDRHGTLNREAYSLARLGLAEHEIASVLLPVAVAVMGETRRGEAERTIRDAVAARGAA